MKTFNVINLESGKIRKVIKADSYPEAMKQFEQSNISLDDNFIELAEETQKHREQQTRYWDLQSNNF
jgi:hypothetical protein